MKVEVQESHALLFPPSSNQVAEMHLNMKWWMTCEDDTCNKKDQLD
jgi:hypothetical protein